MNCYTAEPALKPQISYVEKKLHGSINLGLLLQMKVSKYNAKIHQY